MRGHIDWLIRRGEPRKGSPHASLVLMVGLALLLACNAVGATTASGSLAASATKVDFKNQSASPEVRRVASWVSDSKDNHGMPYLIVDKVNARVFVLDSHGQLLGADAALLGMAKGDRTVAGIGDRKMSAIRPEDRTTPAGRFKASLDHDAHGGEILVIDYAASISLHAVVKGTPLEHRAERLQSATSDDNRISYGCINVPLKFYKNIVSPTFTHTFGIVYILPEMSPASEFFGFHDVAIDSQERDSPREQNDAH
jgi:hypothetical protein